MEINIDLFRLRLWPIGNQLYCWMRTYCFGRFCARATLGVKTKWNIRQFRRTKRTFSAHALVSRWFRSSLGHWCFPNLFHTIVESLHNHLPLFTFTNWPLTESIFDTSQQIKNENGARLLLFSPWCDSDDITSMLEYAHLSKLLKLYWISHSHASIPKTLLWECDRMHFVRLIHDGTRLLSYSRWQGGNKRAYVFLLLFFGCEI